MIKEKSVQNIFDNTTDAFAYKSDNELKKAKFLFAAMGNKFLLNVGLKCMQIVLKYNIPFAQAIIRHTIFKQFVGGETLQETAGVAGTLEKYKVQVVLDYGVEAGEGEVVFDEATQEFIKVIQYAATQKNIPFISMKVTGIARFSLLEKIHSAMHECELYTLMEKYNQVTAQLPAEEKESWEKCVNRLKHICATAHEKKIGVLIDAEESWIQAPVDVLTLMMMDAFNKDQCIVFNTFQFYRHDRLHFLKECFAIAQEQQYCLGAKLVRGAYMEKERKRATEMGYPSPIQADKESSDRDYNAAIAFCIQHLNAINCIVASHNEYSNRYAAQLLIDHSHAPNHPHLHHAQLFGMSDHITFNLAKSGSSGYKCVPFGPIKEVIPYLMRRAQENSSVAGQTGRELGLIKKELERRKRNPHSN